MTTESKNNKKKSVSFPEESSSSLSSSSSSSSSLISTIGYTLNLYDYTGEELDASFYECDELSEFKYEARRIARMVDQQQTIDETLFCTRGTEPMTKEQTTKRRDRRSSAVVAVLREQFWEEPNHDEKIAKIYSELSRESVTSARAMGLLDELYVKNIHYNENVNNHNDNTDIGEADEEAEKLFDIIMQRNEQQQKQQQQKSLKDGSSSKKKGAFTSQPMSLTSLLFGKKKVANHFLSSSSSSRR